MEEWQKDHINDNLPKLIQLTRFNTTVQAALESQGIFSKEDISSLEACKRDAGDFKQSAHLYNLLLSREFAYEKLTKALFETSQSGASKILFEGFTKAGIRTPLTQCGIHVTHHDFANTDILAYGRRIKLGDFFEDIDTTILQKTFYETLPELVYYEQFIQKKEFELFHDTIPPEPAFYVPRFISNRIKINKHFFKSNCADIFVFKGIERYQLIQLAKPNLTASSKDQLDCVTSRFIQLDRDDDWETIRDVATVPVHLINYETSIRSNTSDRYASRFESSSIFYLDQDNLATSSDVLEVTSSDVLEVTSSDLLEVTSSDVLEVTSSDVLEVTSSDVLEVTSSDVLEVTCSDVLKVTSSDVLEVTSSDVIDATKSSDMLDESTSLDEDLVEWAENSDLLGKYNILKRNRCDEIFVLQNTSGNSEVLSKFCSDQDRCYVNEEEFVKRQLHSNKKSNGVYFCDTPGMGKTMLLGNIARNLAKQNKGFTVFIGLSRFLEHVPCSLPNIDQRPAEALWYLLNYITPTNEHTNLLKILIEKKLVKMYFLFDGLDEITSQEVKWVKKMLNLLKTNFNGINIYVTSRTQMRHDLESSLKLVSYDILPFNLENQVEFIVNYWLTKFADCNQVSLKTFALRVLKIVKDTLSRKEEGIAGIPLLCGLIASVYAKEAKSCSSSDQTRCSPRSMSKIYKMFIEMKINQTIEALSKSKGEVNHHATSDRKRVKRFHIWQAWKLLFPGDNCFKNLENVDGTYHENSLMSDVGIVQQQPIGKSMKMEFVHRSFAEFLVAEYLAKYLLSNKTAKPKYDVLFGFIFKKIVSKSCGEKMLPTVIDYFLNSLLTKGSEFRLKFRFTGNQIKLFCESLPADHLSHVLIRCCEESYVKILTVVRKILLSPNCNACDQYNEYFTKERCFFMLGLSLQNCNFHLFSEFLKLTTQAFKPSMEIRDLYKVMLRKAVYYGVYQAVKFLNGKSNLKNPDLLQVCVKRSYYWNDIHSRMLIVQLLLKNDIDTINECPNLLMTTKMHLKILIALVEAGAPVESINPENDVEANCVTFAATYMSPSDFHEFLEFVLCNSRTKYLFDENVGMNKTLPLVIKNLPLLPTTFDLIFKIHGVDPNMVDIHSNNLAFQAVLGNQLTSLEMLFQQGINYKCTGEYQRSLLHVAAKNGNAKTIKYLISLGFDVNKCDENGLTPILLAAEFSDMDTVKLLIKNGADPLVLDKMGGSMLHAAAKGGNLDSISYCVKQGFNIDLKDIEGNSSILVAAEYSQVDAVQLLVSLAADINATNKLGVNILHLAAQEGNIELAKYCIEQNIDPNSCDTEGNTPIMFACRGAPEKVKMIQTLIQLGADYRMTNDYGFNILHLAAKRGDDELLGLCFGLGFDPNSQTKKGNSPIMIAVMNIKLSVFPTLIKAGATCNLVNKSGCNFLDLATKTKNLYIVEHCLNLVLGKNQPDFKKNISVLGSAYWNFPPIIIYLIKKGADYNFGHREAKRVPYYSICRGNLQLLQYLNAIGWDPNQIFDGWLAKFKLLVHMGANHKITNSSGENLLHIAARTNNADLLRYLLTERLPVNQQDVTGDTPIMKASLFGDIQSVRILKKSGANYKLTNKDGQNVFHIACHRANEKLISFCMDIGMDLNLGDIYGNTPFLLAAQSCSPKRIRQMIHFKADPTVMNHKSQTILHIAARYANFHLIKLCIELGFDANQPDENGDSALFLAVKYADKCTVLNLVDHGADCYTTNSQGQTILHVAAERGHAVLVKYCLCHGLEPNQKDNDGSTPLFLAVESGDVKTVEILKPYGADNYSVNYNYLP